MANKRLPRSATTTATRATTAPVAGQSQPSNEPPIHDRSQAEIVALAENTVNGIPLSQLGDRAYLIPYEYTDQGLAERNAKRVDSAGLPHSGAQITRHGGFDSVIAQRADAEDPDDCEDPLLDAATRHHEPGMRFRGLSPLIIQKRTLRGWEVCKEKNGDPVRVGNLLLGKMPIEKANRRREKRRREGADQLSLSKEQFQVNQERLAHDARSKGFEIGTLRDGDVLTDHTDPDRHASIGVHSTRGLQGADAAV